MFVEVLSVSVEDKGKYKMAEVAYKGGDGKVSAKKLMSFGAGEAVFKRMTTSKQGDKFEVTTVKNDKGYWDWTSIQDSQGGSPVASVTTGSSSPKSTYETSEERANRQVLIVRQSSLSNAIEYLKFNTKKAPTIPEVIEVAEMFEDYVFGKKSSPDPIDNLESDIL